MNWVKMRHAQTFKCTLQTFSLLSRKISFVFALLFGKNPQKVTLMFHKIIAKDKKVFEIGGCVIRVPGAHFAPVVFLKLRSRVVLL